MLRLVAITITAIAWSNAPLLAANDGQEDLDKATQLKIAAETLSDLSEVIRLCENALKAGLDEGSTEFAKGLLAGTLIHRAELVCAEIFESPTPPARWPQLRQAALSDLESSLEVDNTQADSHYMIGRLHSLPGGDRKRALSAASKALELCEKNPNLRLKALLLRATLTDDPEKRAADLEEAFKEAPRNVEVVRARGLAKLLDNKFEEAIEDLKAAVELAPNHAETQQALGVTLLLSKNLEEAKIVFDRVIELQPRAAEAYLHRARIHAIHNDNDLALADLNQALEIVPQSPPVLLLRARVFQQAGDVKSALNDTEHVLRLKPGMPEALQLHAVLAANVGRLRAAIDDLEQLARLAPDNPDFLVQLGMFYSADHQPRKAVETFDAVLKNDDASWMAYRGRADAFLSIGKQPEAIADYAKALELQPKNTGILNNLAWVLATSPEQKLRDGKRAVKLANEACELTEFKEAHILSTLAAAYAEIGDFTKAIEWSQKAVELGKGQPQLAKELESYKVKKPWREAQLPSTETPSVHDGARK